MSAHVLLNSLNELGKMGKMRGLSFRNELNKFNNTEIVTHSNTSCAISQRSYE